MSTDSRQIVQKLWSYCNVLRDDGLSYGDYVEQLTYLLFLKMAHEQTQPPMRRPSSIPEGYGWSSLVSKSGDALETHYRHTLEALGKKGGMLGIIFRKALNKIQDPAKLQKLIVDLIDREQWTALDADVKGDAYEGLLEKNAQGPSLAGEGPQGAFRTVPRPGACRPPGDVALDGPGPGAEEPGRAEGRDEPRRRRASPRAGR
jgi:type I restriction enzyme M protein